MMAMKVPSSDEREDVDSAEKVISGNEVEKLDIVPSESEINFYNRRERKSGPHVFVGVQTPDEEAGSFPGRRYYYLPNIIDADVAWPFHQQSLGLANET